MRAPHLVGIGVPDAEIHQEAFISAPRALTETDPEPGQWTSSTELTSGEGTGNVNFPAPREKVISIGPRA